MHEAEGGRNVLVTGGAGFIGSHVVEGYLAQGDRVWVVDNLSSGRRDNVASDAEFVEMELRDPALRDLFREVRFDVVNHHAAQIDVRVSVADPQKDAETNILGFLNLIEAARANGTRRIVYISSGGVVYGDPDVRPTPEQTPKRPMSPYGVSKLSGEYYLDYYRHVHGLEYVALRYSNVYGPRQDPHGEAGVVAIFSTRLLRGDGLLIFGDGEQTRDYVYVADVVRANLIASDLPIPNGADLDAMAFNVGTGVGTSVNQLADGLERVSGAASARRHEPPRPGELRHSVLDASRLRAQGWSPAWSLADGLADTYRWIAEQERNVVGGTP